MDAERWVDRLGRFGLAARGAVYALVAWIVVEVALGRTRQEADERGALAALAAHAPGRAVVAAIAVGLIGLGTWQATIALRRDPEAHRRLVAAGKAVVYAAAGVSAGAIALGRSHRGSGETTARLMHHLAGRLGIGAAGVVVAVGGVVLAVKGLASRYDVDVAPPGRWFEVFGAAAMAARGGLFVLVGAFVVDAAVTFDAGKARGLDGALRSLARDPAGPWLLGAVAAALAVFACFSVLEARYART